MIPHQARATAQKPLAEQSGIGLGLGDFISPRIDDLR